VLPTAFAVHVPHARTAAATRYLADRRDASELHPSDELSLAVEAEIEAGGYAPPTALCGGGAGGEALAAGALEVDVSADVGVGGGWAALGDADGGGDAGGGAGGGAGGEEDAEVEEEEAGEEEEERRRRRVARRLL
jgi:hypothetical protein